MRQQAAARVLRCCLLAAGPPQHLTGTAAAGLSRLLSLDMAALLRGASVLQPGGAGSAGAGAAGAGRAWPAGAGAGRAAWQGAGDDDGLATPHATAAAESLMALSDPLMRGGWRGGAG
jgi:hypothetical protein